MFVIRFTDDNSADATRVGGKGGNLGLLTRAGFPVPGGFSVTTDAYSAFLTETGLHQKIAAIVAQIDYTAPDGLESATAQIRDLVVAQDLPPEITAAVRDAYAQLGADSYVAVRSSGTAEDLAGASFAGLHDTYLDITGADAVLDAVRRCWASLWTARAASYRNTKGFGGTDNGIAVVVQVMVPSEISGVMFTANPVTSATDEIVVNASWGLGEAIVQGIATPDEYVVHEPKLRVKDRVLGAKEVRCVRAPATGVGTIIEAVPAEDAARMTLNDAQVEELALLGRRVQEHYGQVPQDIEWGFADGEFKLLQARPITGVELSWDSDCDDWQTLPEASDDTVWTRSWSDEAWTGAISPLMYSFRGKAFTHCHSFGMNIWGFRDLSKMRAWRYYKGGALFNSSMDREFVARSSFPATRAGLLGNVAPHWHEEVLKAPFSWAAYLKLHARAQFLDKAQGVVTWQQVGDVWIHDKDEEANGLPDEKLRELSDAELRRYVATLTDFETDYIQDVWSAFFIHARDSFSLLGLMLASWYDGDDVLFTDLITGVPRPTATMVENIALFRLAQRLKSSPTMLACYEANVDGAFFDNVGASDEGKAWLANYQTFLAQNGHRGHADRDLYYTRRAEDPSVDYRALGTLLNVDMSIDPEVKEKEVEARRQETINKVVDAIKRKPFGSLRAELFKSTLAYAVRFLLFRDDERHFVDRSTFSIKRGYKEAGRRLVERGVFPDAEAYLFLTETELFSMLEGTANVPLSLAKIEGRRRNFQEIMSRTRENPLYLQNGRSIDHILLSSNDGEGSMQGIATSRGNVEGIARVIRELKDIGRVQEGEILVTNSTDPGWTPVFLVIKGIILETGGMLAHGSCLAREYGFPAVQLPRAMALIPDGARISIDGTTGQIRLLDVDEEHEDSQVPELASVSG